MKRSTSTTNGRQDVISSQTKRIRSSTPINQEMEAADYANDESPMLPSQKKVLKSAPRSSGETAFNDVSNHGKSPIANTSIPLRSTITITSTPSSSSITRKKTCRKLNTSSQVHEERRLEPPPLTVNSPVFSGNKSVTNVLKKPNNKQRSSSTNSTDIPSRPTDLNPKSSSSCSSNKNQTSKVQSTSRCSNVSNISLFDQSSSATTNDPDSSNRDTFPVQSLIEGSLEYREIKRLYLHEKQQAEDWRKDYKVLKRQIAHLNSTTIPRPKSEVLEWLHELIDLMDNKGVFKGDGRSLQKIGNDLRLDETSLITVSARTPQKSALKLFRLLYPTVGSRARLGSISNVPPQQLDNIYYYVRNLHKNLSFDKNHMRKALGTSIRCATSELRKITRYRGQQSSILQNDENRTPNGMNGTMKVSGGRDSGLDGIDDLTDDEDLDKEESDDANDIEDDDDEGADENEHENEDEDDNERSEESNVIIDEELDEDDD